MFSGTGVRLFVYLFISIMSRKSRMFMFSGTVPRLFVYLCISIIYQKFQKCCVFRHCVRLFFYFYYFQKSINVVFSGTVPDYFFIFLLF